LVVVSHYIQAAVFRVLNLWRTQLIGSWWFRWGHLGCKSTALSEIRFCLLSCIYLRYLCDDLSRFLMSCWLRSFLRWQFELRELIVSFSGFPERAD
jgi:hypothetical protein